jgi:hypothetical protein
VRWSLLESALGCSGIDGEMPKGENVEGPDERLKPCEVALGNRTGFVGGEPNVLDGGEVVENRGGGDDIFV